jgi:hypothetical protein
LRITGDTIQPSIGSNITVPSGLGINVGNNKIAEIGADYGAFKGNVVQCRVTRYDVRTSLSFGTSVNGVEITGLRVSITPKFSNSMILCQFQIFGEGATTAHNNLFNVYKNGSVPTTGSYLGYNSEGGNTSWSGISIGQPYDSADNNDSTPSTQFFTYHDFPATTNTLTYAPGIKDSNASNYTYYINRCVGSSGTGSYEVGVSYSTVWEIAQ